MKTCTQCNISKEYTEYYKDKNNKKDGYYHYCKVCKEIKQRIHLDKKENEKRIETEKIVNRYLNYKGEEKWVRVIDYEERYLISNFGRLFSIRQGGGANRNRILNPQTNNDGYYYNTLFKDYKMKQFRIHRLVGLHFVEGKTEERFVIDHKDRNKLNNHYTNLRWATVKENNNNKDNNINQQLP